MIRRFVRVAAAAFGAAIVLVPSHVRAQYASEPERREGGHSPDLGVGGARIRGVAIGGVGVGGMDLKGGFLTPGIFRVERGGRFQGVAVAGYSQVRGTQRGLTIGVVNYARRLRGVQIGLINIAKSNPRGSRVLPVFNADFSR